MKVGDWIRCVDTESGRVREGVWYCIGGVDFKNGRVAVKEDTKEPDKWWYPFSSFDTDYPIKDNPNTVGCDCESVVKKEEIIEPEQRFLETKVPLISEIIQLMTQDIGIPVGVNVVTLSNRNNERGTCEQYKTFPFTCNIEITYCDEMKVYDVIETIAHELVHAYTNKFGFMRNTISKDNSDYSDVEERFAAGS